MTSPSATSDSKIALEGRRIIFHVDVNSAFLSWSAIKQLQDDPGSVDLRTIPSAVAGDVKTRHGIITAKSIPAKKYGIRTAEPVVKALQKCPQLVLVKSDFDTYRAYSRALMELLSQFTPLIRQISVDEAWLDVTERIPDETRAEAVRLADRIRQTVFKTLGFTVNVGVSENKLLSKMASDFTKPDRTHTLFPDEISRKMWPLPIGDLYGCGAATASKLHSVGISTIGDAAATDPVIMQSILGEKAGLYIHNSANGRGSSIVTPEREKAKSISNEITLESDVTAENYEAKAVPVIRRLAEKVSDRMKKAGMIGQTVTFQVKASDFQRFSRQMSLPAPENSVTEIQEAALQLAQKLLLAEDGLFASGAAIRLIGVGVSKLSEDTNRQMDLFAWAAHEEERQKELEAVRRRERKQAQLDEMMKKVHEKYGEEVLRKGSAE